MPTRQQIADYWMASAPFDFGLASEWLGFMDDELVENECWACGDILRLERCHIVPVADGGTDDPSNLVILCARCHIKSEGLTETVFQVWFKNSRKTTWQQPWMHSRDRVMAFGYTEADLLTLCKDKNPEESAKLLFQTIYGEEA